MRLQKRPLRALMQALADLLPGTWEPLSDQSGYILHMSPAAMRRRDRWWELFLRERNEALAAQRAAVLQALRAEPFRRKPDDPNPEHSDLAIEREKASEQEFFNALSPAMQESIADNINDLRLSSRGGDIGFCEEEAVHIPFHDLPSAAQNLLQKHPSIALFASRRDVNWNDVTVRFNNLGYGVMGSIALGNGDATSVQTSRYIPFTDAATLLFAAEPLVKAVRRLGPKAPNTWKELAAYQTGCVWPNDAPQHPPRQSPPPHRADALRQFGVQNGIEYVADYYSVPGFPLHPAPAPADAARRKAQASPQTVKALLDDAAALHDLSWKQEKSGVYLFRSNRWYRDDLLEAPAGLLHRWMTDMATPERKRRGSWQTIWTPEDIRAQMDWEADVVSNLTLWQIGNGLEWAADEDYLGNLGVSLPVPAQFPDLNKSFPLEYQAERILREYRTASFYASLSGEQRDALIAGRLPLAALTGDQQRQVAALTPRLRTLLTGSSGRIMLGLYSNIGKELLDMNNMPRVRLTAALAPQQ